MNVPANVARPALSIVIPVYDNWWLTARCLRALELLRTTDAPPFETIVVDNASTDETPRSIADFPWVRYVRQDRNRNFAGACNAGAALAQAPLVLLLNNDAYPLGDALTPLVAAFDRPEIAIAGGALFFEDGVTQAAGLVVLPDAHWHYSYRNLPATLPGVTTPRDALGVGGAALAVRTRWLLDSGGLDESFINGFEDVDLCLRARDAGSAIAYVATARFAHYEAASAGRFDRERENERRFYAQWASRFAALPRTARGEVGAICVRDGSGGDPLLAAARCDLEDALRAFGHPVTHRPVGRWRRFDRRFSHAARLGWFSGAGAPPGITISRRPDAPAAICTHGAIELEVPWLPCAAPQRVAACSVRRSGDPSCRLVGVAGDRADPQGSSLGYPTVRITPQMLLGDAPAVDVACVVHYGLTDDSAFGNVLLAQAGLPSIVEDSAVMRALFSSDVAMMTERAGIADAIARFVADASLRDHHGRLVAADARRRFSPRRSAIRTVDLLCAARFGLERPARSRSNTPL